ncbi:HlyD family secretion protein [Kozakia baliensis]|uniref:Secretion protein HylD n=1 Tax=Kozakia baliensis TaxID=153496 RepID=A0A1D8UT44_9PROT|nr:HlyD family secretion protein [Kozakia baliensis]AOX16834.1 secretion protein HylD [Kozakia baliensis]GBR24361.1 major facilitator superfamily multidrug resistance transporter HlyD/EmrA/FusE [Kozakia baliensis NRIC 0488]GEL64726.1 multidrug resistance protein A [Kozakia baliensis]
MSSEKSDEEKKASPKWPFFIAGLIVLTFSGIVLAIIFVPSREVWTNDAYVTAHYSTIAPRISGQVIAVDVDDNQPVKAGQVLARLDPRDYQTTLDRDKANLAHDKALALDAQAAVDRQPAIIDENVAEAARISAQLTYAEQNALRYRNLSQTGAGSTQERQQSDASLREMEANLRGTQAQIAAARAQVPILRAQHNAALETIRLDEAQLHQAELNLSYTHILAPMDGMVGERNVQVGNYVSPGTALMAVVPMHELWIMANYRELALRHMRPGQPVRIHVDAYNIDLDGIVDSVPPASGAAFSPIAPENATGNFTKIVQRLPVKIVLKSGQPLANLLRMGFSVETSVDTGFENVVGEQQNTHAEITAK